MGLISSIGLGAIHVRINARVQLVQEIAVVRASSVWSSSRAWCGRGTDCGLTSSSGVGTIGGMSASGVCTMAGGGSVVSSTSNTTGCVSMRSGINSWVSLVQDRTVVNWGCSSGRVGVVRGVVTSTSGGAGKASSSVAR